MKRDGYMPQHLRWALRTATVALLVGLLCLLQACGGGDDLDDPANTADGTKTAPPITCTTHPETCR